MGTFEKPRKSKIIDLIRFSYLNWAAVIIFVDKVTEAEQESTTADATMVKAATALVLNSVKAAVTLLGSEEYVISSKGALNFETGT